MASKYALSTRVLLICAAIAVPTGIFSAFAGLWSAPMVAAAPMFYGILLASHLIPGTIAQDLIRKPWVGILTHMLAALIATATQPPLIGNYLGAAILMGGVQEGWVAIARYRKWSGTWLVLGGVVLGVVLGMTAGLAIGLKYLPLWGAVGSVVFTVAGAIVWTIAGLAISKGLRRAGVAPSGK